MEATTSRTARKASLAVPTLLSVSRNAGFVGVALSSRAYMLLFAGELTAAASLMEEVQAVTEATGSNLAPHSALGLAALRGKPQGLRLSDQSLENQAGTLGAH